MRISYHTPPGIQKCTLSQLERILYDSHNSTCKGHQCDRFFLQSPPITSPFGHPCYLCTHSILVSVSPFATGLQSFLQFWIHNILAYVVDSCLVVGRWSAGVEFALAKQGRALVGSFFIGFGLLGTPFLGLELYPCFKSCCYSQ